VALRSGANQGAVCVAVAKKLAGFEHLLHNCQSTMRSAITKQLKVHFAVVSLFLVAKVLDCAHQAPLAVQRQCRPRTSGAENLDRQLHGLQRNADLGQARATLESFEVFGT
jgi:hypothetical protein